MPPRTVPRSVTLVMTIRLATIEDAAAVAEVHVRTWQSAYRGLLPDHALNSMTPEQRRPMWERLLGAAPGTASVIVAVCGDMVAGIASFGPADDAVAAISVFELYALYVDPAAQRQGIGRLLLLGAEDAMQRAGSTLGQLWVLDGNEPAQRFYRSHGWHADGVSKEDVLFGVPVREVRFGKSLLT